MEPEIYDPLNEYVNIFQNRFQEIAKKTFAELAKEAEIDVVANRDTCKRLYATNKLLSSVRTRIGWWRFLSVLLWLVAIGGVITIFILQNSIDLWILVSIGVGSTIFILLFFIWVYPKIRRLKKVCNKLTDTILNLKNQAWQQMEPLNKLYDWDILTRMMSQTLPRLEFDPYFTTQRLIDLKVVYGWDDSFNAERSVIYSHSGLINGNPFILCRTRKMEMGTKSYTGEKTIHWTTRERGADGKMRTVHHSETLVATVTAPYPEYYEKTRLIYGNTAAPDLIFTRKQNGLAGHEKSFAFKRQKHSLRKKSRDLKHADFAMLTNEDFEVAFNTSDRNNNQQYALLFTPLAQESMMNLLKDKEVGYGDDFDFRKYKMINTIVSNHIQQLDMDMNPKQYQNFDYDKAEADFYNINAVYFRAIYFCLAPLLCIPMYQQIRSQENIYGRDMERHSSFWEHEALANFWGQNHFKHPNCVTDCILKTEQKEIDKNRSIIKVSAHGYRSVQRLTYVEKWGGDGKLHKVPVYWDEYLPVTGVGQISIQEDNDDKENTYSSQKERLYHIGNILSSNKLTLYRRHIASKL